MVFLDGIALLIPEVHGETASHPRLGRLTMTDVPLITALRFRATLCRFAIEENDPND
jgi:hypothetical protein